MSVPHEQFNLDRKISIENHIDPTGRKWEIKGERGSALVHVRPNPDREDAIIPREFGGKWTSPSVLNEKVVQWLENQWNKSDAEAIRRAQQANRTPLPQKVEEVKTPEQSLEDLPDEIKEALGDIIAVKEPEDESIEEEKEKEPVAKTKAGKQTKKNSNKKPTGRSKKEV
jgi:hypothetical protein